LSYRGMFPAEVTNVPPCVNQSAAQASWDCLTPQGRTRRQARILARSSFPCNRLCLRRHRLRPNLPNRRNSRYNKQLRTGGQPPIRSGQPADVGNADGKEDTGAEGPVHPATALLRSVPQMP